MEKICKNCKLHFSIACQESETLNIGYIYAQSIVTPDESTCESFDPIQEDNNEEK